MKWLKKLFKPKPLSENDLRDMWLKKYHNTTSSEIAEMYPEESKSPDWFKLFPCTQEQHDEWEKKAKRKVKRYNKNIPDPYFERMWGFTYLNVAPYVEK